MRNPQGPEASEARARSQIAGQGQAPTQAGRASLVQSSMLFEAGRKPGPGAAAESINALPGGAGIRGTPVRGGSHLGALVLPSRETPFLRVPSKLTIS